jgi:hypothetical protein
MAAGARCVVGQIMSDASGEGRLLRDQVGPERSLGWDNRECHRDWA